MKVKDYLPKLKANKYTYYNLDKKTIQDFKDLYKYLKKHKEKNVSNYFQWTDSLKCSVNYWLNNKNYIDYVKKFKAMEIISQAITYYNLDKKRFYSWDKSMVNINEIIIFEQEKENENSYNCISHIIKQLLQENPRYKFHLKNTINN